VRDGGYALYDDVTSHVSDEPMMIRGFCSSGPISNGKLKVLAVGVQPFVDDETCENCERIFLL
jgi:hypothetical protein